MKLNTNYNITDLSHDFLFLNQRPKIIFLDNASTTQKPIQVISQMSYSYTNNYASVGRGDYFLSNKMEQDYENARDITKSFINASDKEEIIFTSGTTESINTIAYSIAHILSENDNIVISNMEHTSNIFPWLELAKRKKAAVKFIELDDTCNLKNIFQHIDSNTKIVSITHCSNSVGVVNDVKNIIASIKAYNNKILVLIDGAQSVTHMLIDVQDMGCDFFVFSGHKIYGPNGIGVLYAKKSTHNILELVKSGGGTIEGISHMYSGIISNITKRFEPGTVNAIGAIGLGRAIQYLQSVDYTIINNLYSKLNCLTKILLNKHFPDINIMFSSSGPIISFHFNNVHSYDIGTLLSRDGVCVRTGHLCNHHLIRQFNLPPLIRVSFGLYNTVADVHSLITSLKTAILKLSI